MTDLPRRDFIKTTAVAGLGVAIGVPKMGAGPLFVFGGSPGEKVRVALEKSNYDAILGPMRFDDHHQARTRMMWIVIEKGTPVVKELVAVK